MTQPNPIDVAIGLNLRALRERAQLSQGKLGEPSGITFQQVQKYEQASNRISASRLVEFAATLKCSVSDFFDGVPTIAAEMEEQPELTTAARLRLSELCEAMAMELGLTLKTVEGRHG